MRLAFLGDIHGNLPALEKVLSNIERESVDDIYCTGDIVGYGPQPNEVIDVIRDLSIKTVMGNHDEAVGYNLPVCGCNYATTGARAAGEKSLAWTKEVVAKEKRRFLRELPEELSIYLPGNKSASVFHGSPRAINEYLHSDLDEEILNELITDTHVSVFIFGHTHIPFMRSFKGRLFINAGSVGQPKDGDNRACYVLADFYSSGVSLAVKRVEYDTGQVVAMVEKAGLPAELAEILRTGRAL